MCLKLVFEASFGLSELLLVTIVIITFEFMTKCNFWFVVVTLDTFSSLQVLKRFLSLLVFLRANISLAETSCHAWMSTAASSTLNSGDS